MTYVRQPSALFAAALVAALVAGTAAAAGLGVAATPFAAVGALVATLGLIVSRKGPTVPAGLVERVSQQAHLGRRLVIYERETGLFAHWYVALRGQEECDRARRYDHPLTVLVLEPSRPEDAWDVKERLAEWCAGSLRATDIAGYLGNGRYVVIMPETDAAAARNAVGRLLDSTPEVVVGISAFATDGHAFDDLYQAAASRLEAPRGRTAA